MRRKLSVILSQEESFCETVTAGPMTPWHIRRLTDAGKKYGGGADTKALCGREVAWDLRVGEALEESICKVCLEKWMGIHLGEESDDSTTT